MPFAMCINRLRPAVVHEDAGVIGPELEREGLARVDVAERDVWRDARGVEVDRVRDRSAVRQRHLDQLALADVQDRARGAVAAERPGVVLDARRDLDGHVLQRQVDVRDGTRGRGRERRVIGLVRFGECLRIRRDDAREAVERHRAHLRVVHRLGGLATSVVGVGPHHQREEADDSDGDPEQQGGDLEEGARVGFGLVV
jgi:hypothetical protein